jgi:hypothetical protein
MQVVAVAAVLELTELLPFQEMRRLGLVRPLDPERDLVTIFVSHQCTSQDRSSRASLLPSSQLLHALVSPS